LDGEKHYWVAEGEVENLMRRGEGWLASHPERDLILRRALKNQRDLIGPALERLAAIEEAPAGAMVEDRDEAEAGLEKQIGLNERRMNQVHATLKEIGAKRVVDLGCGEGKLLQLLIKDNQFTQITGMDVAPSVLKRAARRLNLADLPRLVRERLTLFQGSLVYRDMRLANYDAATLIEVIEHLDSDRLTSLERVVFGFARPAVVIVTTPNIEYNARFPRLPAGNFRHADHRFEWTRAEFKDWASGVAERHGYSWEHRPVGDDDQVLGPPTQMALFRIAQSGGAP
jgi:3' terminal RNA ribose 2'-O-methyltransferase Hen1